MVITWSLLPKDFASSMAALTVRSWLAALLRSSGSRISLNISTSPIAGPSGRCLRKAPAVSPPLRPGDQAEQQQGRNPHELLRRLVGRHAHLGDLLVEVEAGFRSRRIILRAVDDDLAVRSEEHTSELQSLMRISYSVFCLKKKKQKNN